MNFTMGNFNLDYFDKMTDILHEFLSLFESNAFVFVSDKCFEQKLQKIIKNTLLNLTVQYVLRL